MLKQGWYFCRNIIKNFFAENCPMQAASLAYVSLLSIVPLMTVSLTILSIFPVFKGIGDQIQKFVFANFVASSAQTLQQYIQTFMHQTTKLSLPGMLFLLVTAVLMIFAMEQAFNRIWQVQKHRNIIQAFLMYWAVLTLTPILIGAGLVISSYLLSFPFIQISLIALPYLLTFLAFMLLYIIVPNCKVKIRYAASGALIATILFESAKYGFTLYIAYFPTYKLIYGALAVIPIFLVWLYLSWLIVLFGVSISHSLASPHVAE
jgi:membrane protein